MTRMSHTDTRDAPGVLIVVQNLPVPLDRRVWLECQALRDRGYTVSVICPKGPGDPEREILDGIALYKYRPAPQAEGPAGFALEFVYCWLRTAWLSLRVRRERGFDVLQACNPPDTYWALARLWRRRGVRFVFDHHDLNPELFLSRFGEPTTLLQRAQLGLLRWLERRTFREADHVVSTNTSYRRIAMERGGLPGEQVTVARSGPDTTVMRPVYPRQERTSTAAKVLVYLGIMGPQDGVCHVLEVMEELVHRRGRRDVRAVLLGFGDCLADLRRQCTDMGLDPVVQFTGRVGPQEIAQQLSAADIGLGPDPKTPLNDLSSMNKTMEYMAFALPSVAFDLTETRATGADTVLYATPGSITDFADAVERLLDDPDLRADLGLAARRRVSEELDWRPQRAAYVQVFDRITGWPGQPGRAKTALPSSPTAPEPDLVDLTDAEELRRYIRTRRRPSRRPAA